MQKAPQQRARGQLLPALMALCLLLSAVCAREGGEQVQEQGAGDEEGRHPEAIEVASSLRRLFSRLAAEGSEAQKLGERDKAIECHEDSLLVTEMWRILQELHGELPSLPPVSPLARRADGDL